MSEDPTLDATVGFAELGLRRELTDALATLGYEEPTPIQRAAIPPLLEGRDLMGLAATGTGKTAAFALPILERITTGGKQPAALVLVPTRELAVQVAQAVHRYGRALGVQVLPLYGGQPFRRQLDVLKRGVDVVVATPGRALDHIRRRTLDLGALQVLVLDEADEMLDMGFAEDLEAILSEIPERRQTLLFSATLGGRITAIARRHLVDPVEVRISGEPRSSEEAPLVRQVAYLVARAHKLAALGRVLDLESPEATLVFCRTRNDVDELTQALAARGHRAEAMHGGMSQDERTRVMGRLRAGTVDLLVATDVAARGLDISHLSHVVNHDVPSEPASYVHRVGRVGRAGREGVAITLVSPREHVMLRNIERYTRRKISVETLPTVADLRARRLELTRATLRETLLAGELDEQRVVVESLADEFDLFDIATAAVKLVHEATHPTAYDEEEEIPVPSPPPAVKGKGAGKGKGAREKRQRLTGGTRIFIGLGRTDGVRPQDLVGAITGESGIRGHQIGSIQISERFSIVELADDVAELVLRSMRGATIKGKKAVVRPDRAS